MKRIGKSSHAGLMFGAIILLACFFVVVAVNGAKSDPQAKAIPSAGPSPAMGAFDHAASARPIAGSTLADAAAKIELASDFNKASSRNFADEVLPEAYEAARWRDFETTSRETGAHSSGWFARDLFTSMDCKSDIDKCDIVNDANQISFIQGNGVLHAAITLLSGEDVQFQLDYNGNPFQYLNVAFDLPSGKHRYMRLIVYPTKGGDLLVADESVPELFAQTLTTEYTHIFLPLLGQRDTEELMFYNESFRALMPPEERATAEAAMHKADQAKSR